MTVTLVTESPFTLELGAHQLLGTVTQPRTALKIPDRKPETKAEVCDDTSANSKVLTVHKEENRDPNFKMYQHNKVQ